MKKIVIITALVMASSAALANGCQSSWVFGDNVASCVMKAGQDDRIASSKHLHQAVVQVYQSTPGDLNHIGERLTRMANVALSSRPENNVDITVDLKQHQQTVLGFGAALTDSAVINLQAMPSQLRQQVLYDTYSADGLGYNLLRVPMAASDYSTHMYTYLDKAPAAGVNAVTYVQQYFALAKEDLQGKIPLIKQIETMTGNALKVFASPWSAPAWMKVGEKADQPLVGGDLNPAYYSAWTMYFKRFLQSYQAAGITFWGITLQNEPTDVMNFIPSMGYAYQGQDQTHDFIMQALAPMLQRNYPALKLMVGDDEVQNLHQTLDGVLADPQVASNVSGIAFHPYFTKPDWQQVLGQLHQANPSKFLLSSEYSYAEMGKGSRQKVGDWQAAMDYASKIMGVLNHGGAGFMDWNLVLDTQHGPDFFMISKTQAALIYNAQSQLVYKTPLYYIIGQFSHFIVPGSQHVQLNISNPALNATAFVTPEHRLILVVANQTDQSQAVSANIGDTLSFKASLPANAVATYQLAL